MWCTLADLSLWLNSRVFLAPWQQSMSTYSQPSFSSSTWKRGGVWMCKLGVISRTIEDRGCYYWLLTANHICHFDWHNNGWPWLTLNGHLAHRALSLFLLWKMSHSRSRKYLWLTTMRSVCPSYASQKHYLIRLSVCVCVCVCVCIVKVCEYNISLIAWGI